MKKVTISIPVQVSDCGKYCDAGCQGISWNDFFRNNCGYFTVPHPHNTRSLQPLYGDGSKLNRCQQCIDAERAADTGMTKLKRIKAEMEAAEAKKEEAK
jgi:hypothetical protein